MIERLHRNKLENLEKKDKTRANVLVPASLFIFGPCVSLYALGPVSTLLPPKLCVVLGMSGAIP